MTKEEIFNRLRYCEGDKVYIIRVSHDKNFSLVDGYIQRINCGFNAFELLGLCEHIRDEVLKQMGGSLSADLIKREVLDTKTKVETKDEN